jgi:hypothetical protein
LDFMSKHRAFRRLEHVSQSERATIQSGLLPGLLPKALGLRPASHPAQTLPRGRPGIIHEVDYEGKRMSQ